MNDDFVFVFFMGFMSFPIIYYLTLMTIEIPKTIYSCVTTMIGYTKLTEKDLN